MWNKSYIHDDTEPTQCPVCKTLFGKRDKTITFKAHCAECRATFTWEPFSNHPTATLDLPKHRDNKKYCSPTGCVCRD